MQYCAWHQAFDSSICYNALYMYASILRLIVKSSCYEEYSLSTLCHTCVCTLVNCVEGLLYNPLCTFCLCDI